jgi:hypothetical protein
MAKSKYKGFNTGEANDITLSSRPKPENPWAVMELA